MQASRVAPWIALLLTAACSRSPSAGESQPGPGEPASPAFEVAPEKLLLFGALTQSFASAKRPVTDAKVELGRMLFFEDRLSKNHDHSCNSCHDLANYGVDGARFSTGHRGQKGGRNSPTVYNAAGHVAQFWDGREPDVEAQAKGPMLNPVEMAMPGPDRVVAVLRSIPDYAPLFERAFHGENAPIALVALSSVMGALSPGKARSKSGA